jgi:phage tail-like protein
MSTSTADIKSLYPLPVYNYRVEIDGVPIAFSEVSGLAIAVETTTYKESPTTSGKVGPTILYMPSQPTMTTLTLKKGLVRGASLATLYTWINSTKINQIQKKDITIRLMDETGAPVISWKVMNAFPTKLDAPTFDANSNDVAVESMTLTADTLLIEEA